MDRAEAEGEGGGLLSAAEFYQRVAPDYDRRYAHAPAYTQTQAQWLERNLPRGRVLDLGCGTGRMLRPLARGGFAPVGLDFVPAMLTRAAMRNPGLPLVLADACRPLPFADQSFSGAVCLHSTLSHFTDPQGLACLAAEMLRVLEFGGVFVAEVAHPRSYPNPGRAGSWRRFRRDLSCRRAGAGLEEMRLEDGQGISTLVRVMEPDMVDRWLADFRRVELYSGFSGQAYHPRRGDIMLIRAVR